MLKRRIIPTLLMKNGMLVKGERFDSWRRIGPVLPMVRVYETRGVDELILLDIGATPEGRGPDMATIAAVADECMMPLTVGGGIRDLDTIQELLRIGADKVAICTAAMDDPGIIDAAAKRFGSQCITVAIDVRHGFAIKRCGTVWVNPASISMWSPERLAKGMERMGAGEILLTSIDKDGTLQGYDLDLIRSVSQAVSIPVIASGGARDYDDFAAAFEAGAHAVAASALFQFTESTPLGAKRHLAEQGIPVRL
ncbi:MAG TPA: imidazole glycerol phosphate synthase subunit HisF [Marinobacter sp.]|uniref:imidazole glycerol-phosphate synthase n=1 Tax=marine sediment metagenome TaxID=412755 RepID=A0A0F9RC48_9ZZZZ|nr:imidazole glycerol phosphate synthase subunit HisF [Marinobacter sp.]